ncbi:NADPH-dependent F420 reductase [Okibacterium fritillariae]|uniref:NADPH-dependent F420 reductase n=1 Tax=Okibacterium fritillariae TaxID=123320 RepID=UPI0040556BD3
MTTLGLIGAGNIGSQLARLAAANGYDIVISNSRTPDTLSDLIHELGDNARAATPIEAAEAADIAVVTIPLKAIDQVPVEQLEGKIVIDTNNYYPQRDGNIAELDDESTTVSEMLQKLLPGSYVVKAFNNIAAADLTADARPADADDRRALPIAGDDEDSKASVVTFIEKLGFDVVDAGPLAEGWRFQRDTPAYGLKMTAEDIHPKLAEAKRYRDM